MLGAYLSLFAITETLVYVFMQIITKLATIQRVIIQKANLVDYIFFTLIFGGFSIFGTLVGIPSNYGAICNVRDLSPMIAGLVAGPIVGLAVGLIGGMHRMSIGGLTCLPCSLATVLAGLLAGLVFLINRKKLIDIIPAILFAIGIELLHGGLVLAIVRPFSAALEVTITVIPPMIIANALGLAVSILVIHSRREIEDLKSRLS
jgi:sigma-B regulation protein RsbU (phosphoserine phosphatase)